VESGLPAIGHAIQLAVAPVFLVSGVGALLAVLTHRLSRIIDRARLLEAALASPIAGEHMRTELAALMQRARLINRAIGLATMCALLVCGVITLLFVGAFANFDASTLVGVMFIAAMLALIGGLWSFLGEVRVAIRSLTIGAPPRIP
jgi:uncharacterized protein DUF2721